MNAYTNFVVDIETLGKYDSSIVTRIAITPFKFEEMSLTFKELVDRTMYIAINQNEQIALGRVSDEETMKWWSEQTEELRTESIYSTNNDYGLADMFAECKRFMNAWQCNRFHSFLWARNCGFEGFKLQSMNDQVHPGEKHVFNNWNWQEVKTANYLLSGGETFKFKPEGIDEGEFQCHNAKHDSAMDAYRLLQLWKTAND